MLRNNVYNLSQTFQRAKELYSRPSGRGDTVVGAYQVISENSMEFPQIASWLTWLPSKGRSWISLNFGGAGDILVPKSYLIIQNLMQLSEF